MITLAEVEHFLEVQLNATRKLLTGLLHEDPDKLILEGRKHAYKEILSVVRGEWKIK